jgi:hypothetical protein
MHERLEEMYHTFMLLASGEMSSLNIWCSAAFFPVLGVEEEAESSAAASAEPRAPFVDEAEEEDFLADARGVGDERGCSGNGEAEALERGGFAG